MLEDRDYMRAQPFKRPGPISWTTILMIVNGVVFLAQSIAGYYFQEVHIDRYFALSISGLQSGCFWQPITFQFMHAGLFHLLANLITIYFFGRAVEESLGKAAFLKVYFGSGVIGGLLQVLAAFLWPGHFGAGAVVGASAGAFGLVAAFATLYPERPLTLLIFFVIPVSMRSKFLVIFSVLLALFGIIVPMDNIAHVAHLGGILVGVVMVRWGAQAGWPELVRRRVQPVARPRELAEVRFGKPAWRAPKPVLEELPPAEFISKEVDPILDKISAHGIQSLTPQERRILAAASTKIGKT